MLKQKMPFKNLFLIFSLFFNMPILCMQNENEGDYSLAVIVEGLDGEHESGNKDLLGEGILLEKVDSPSKKKRSCCLGWWRDNLQEEKARIERSKLRLRRELKKISDARIQRENDTQKSLQELYKLKAKVEERRRLFQARLSDLEEIKNEDNPEQKRRKKVKSMSRQGEVKGQEAEKLLNDLQQGVAEDSSDNNNLLLSMILGNFKGYDPEDIETFVLYLQAEKPGSYGQLCRVLEQESLSIRSIAMDDQGDIQKEEKKVENNAEKYVLTLLAEHLQNQNKLLEKQDQHQQRITQLKKEEVALAYDLLDVQARLLEDALAGGDEDRRSADTSNKLTLQLLQLEEERKVLEDRSRRTAKKRFWISTGITVGYSTISTAIALWGWLRDVGAIPEDMGNQNCNCNDTMAMNRQM